MLKKIKISQNLINKYPNIKLACLKCNIKVEKSSQELLDLITDKIAESRKNIEKTENISKIETIKFSREAYKKLGKDPSRYRLSAEALLRRIIKDKNLYKVNNVVDIINLVSFSTGFSIGGYDYQKIDQDIVFDIGLESDDYQAIGRGKLNITNLPTFRDKIGAFGSPTSDSTRTMLTEDSKEFLMIIIGFGNIQNNTLEESLNESISLFKKYASAKNIESWYLES